MTHAPSADGRSQATLSTPVVFFIFNRPQETAQVWQAIRTTRPARLYIVSDAPRPGVAGEASRVQECRKIAESIDWPCQVETDYAVQNLGCGARISSGLNKVFSREERAIILEDDTVPEPSFFRFCETLLERYADHKHGLSHQRPKQSHVLGHRTTAIFLPGDRTPGVGRPGAGLGGRSICDWSR